MLSTGNPALQPSQFESQLRFATASNVMTVQGTVVKTAILTGVLLVAGAVSFGLCHPSNGTASQGLKFGMIIGGLIGTLICGISLFFSQRIAPVLAPAYAVFEGMLLGALAGFYENRFNGIIPQAVLLTIGLLGVMLLAYSTGVIRATPFVTKMIVLATGAICLTYLVSLVSGLLGYPIPYIHSAGPIGIGFSAVVVGIAAFNFILDFDMIESGAQAQAPKYMEWYAAYGLLVTLAWLYLEVLRLLAKIRSND